MIQVERVFLEECLARLEGLILACKAESDALSKYFDRWGVEHEYEDCPQDDTCSCPENEALSDAWDALGCEIELAHRRIDKIRSVLSKNPGEEPKP